MLLVNEILHGRYRIIRQLGHGGMGAVYEAHDSVFETTVALKEIIIDSGKSQNPGQHDLILRAFEREAKILAKIKHETVPHVRDYFTDTNRQFLVMELVEGKDLGGLLEERKTPFPTEDVVRWVEQLLDGLDYLHTQNPPIYHRDLKPQNLKITPRGRIKLLDFGIAKGGAETPNSTTVNNQTFVAATLNYSPIEQIFRVLDPTFREVLTQRFDAKIRAVMAQNADARSDLYALGATAYHLLTGQLPIDALKRTMEVWSGKFDPLTHPMSLNTHIPPEICTVLLKAMEIDHDRRYVSAIEMQQALNQAMATVRGREKNLGQDTIKVSDQDAWQIEQERQRQLEAQRSQQTRLPERQYKDEATQIIPREMLPISEQTIEGGVHQPTPFGTPFGNQTGGQQNTDVNPTFQTGGNNPFPTGGNNPFPTGGSQMPTQQINFAGVSTGGGALPNNPVSTGGGGFPNNPVSTGGSGYSNNPMMPAPGFVHSQQTFVPQKKSGNKIFWILPVLALLFLTVGGAGFGLWMWQRSLNDQGDNTSTPTPTVTATATATATPSATPPPTNVSGGSGTSVTPTQTPTVVAPVTPAPSTPSSKVPAQTKPQVVPPSRQTQPRQTNEPSAKPKTTTEPYAKPKTN